MRYSGVLIALTVVLGGTCTAQQSRRPITPADAFSLRGLSDPHLSPDGKDVVYVVSTPDRTKDKRISTIWNVPADGSAKPEKFIRQTPARSPRWSPDGKWLAYITAAAEEPQANENGAQGVPAEPAAKVHPKSQVWIVRRDGTDARRVTSFPNGVTAFSWSPDSTRLAVVTRMVPRGESPSTDDVKHYTYIFYKENGAGWDDHKRGHIWIVPIGSGAPKQITFGATSDDSDPAWSPNGKWIAYVSLDRSDQLRSTMNMVSILAVPSTGGKARIIVDHSSAHDPRWSPDSRRIAYIGVKDANSQPLLWIANADGQGQPMLASDLDRSPTEIHWTSDGALWFGATDHGAAHLYRIAPGSNHAQIAVGGERALHMLSLSLAHNRIAFVANDPLHPPAVFSATAEDQQERQLGDENDEWLARLELQGVERLNFTGADGLPIQGFFMKPLNWKPGEKYPMVLAIHGGPSGMYGDPWEMDLQLYAAQGWAVFFCNPRGSTGYGTQFQRAVAEQWGGTAYRDIMAGVDAALAKYSWIDPNRLGVVGWSYGGFMTDWIVTQTHRFRAAISIAGISDLESDEGTRDFAYGHAHDFGGDVFTNRPLYRKYSAVLRAADVKTPMLFLHGEADERVPPSQSEEYFRALKHFGDPTELVLFPKENHMLPVASSPKHLVESYEWRLYWFDRYLNGDQSAVEPGTAAVKPAVH